MAMQNLHQKRHISYHLFSMVVLDGPVVGQLRAEISTTKPTNWCYNVKRDDTHPRATIVCNACYNVFRKRL